MRRTSATGGAQARKKSDASLYSAKKGRMLETSEVAVLQKEVDRLIKQEAALKVREGTIESAEAKLRERVELEKLVSTAQKETDSCKGRLSTAREQLAASVVREKAAACNIDTLKIEMSKLLEGRAAGNQSATKQLQSQVSSLEQKIAQMAQATMDERQAMKQQLVNADASRDNDVAAARSAQQASAEIKEEETARKHAATIEALDARHQQQIERLSEEHKSSSARMLEASERTAAAHEAHVGTLTAQFEDRLVIGTKEQTEQNTTAVETAVANAVAAAEARAGAVAEAEAANHALERAEAKKLRLLLKEATQQQATKEAEHALVFKLASGAVQLQVQGLQQTVLGLEKTLATLNTEHLATTAAIDAAQGAAAGECSTAKQRCKELELELSHQREKLLREQARLLATRQGEHEHSLKEQKKDFADAMKVAATLQVCATLYD
jgi:hypothetical protein